MKFTNWLAFLLMLTAAHGATLIGSDASMTVPTSAEWLGIINFKPGHGETVTLNPPPFSWVYQAPTAKGEVDGNSYTGRVQAFRFQCDYSSSFTSPVVDVITSNSCYNYLAPFTSNTTVYWRVLYLNQTNLTTNAISSTRSFFVSATATNWDRSFFTNASYWAAKTHPYLLFNSSNRVGMLQYLQTNNVNDWLRITNAAKEAVTQNWWTASDVLVAASIIQSNRSTIAGLPSPTFSARPLSSYEIAAQYPNTYDYGVTNCTDWQGIYSIMDTRLLYTNNTKVSGTNNFFELDFAAQMFKVGSPTCAVAVVFGLYDGTNNNILRTNTFALTTANAAFYVNVYLTNNGPVIAGSRLTASIYALSTQSPNVQIGVGPYKSYLYAKGVLDNGTYGWYIGNLAFVYALTGDTNWLAYNPMQRLSDAATFFKANYWDQGDVVAGSPFPKFVYGLAFGYDYLYNDMTTEQRTNVLGALEAMSYYALKSWWYSDPANSNRTYAAGSDRISEGAAMLFGSAHGNVSQNAAMYMALASRNESAKSAEALDYMMNYALGVTYPYGSEDGWNQGRWYNYFGLLNGQGAITLQAVLASTLPEAQIHLNPFLRSADWLMRMTPVKWQQYVEPWGDTGDGPLFTWEANDYLNFALLSKNPEIWQHHLNHKANNLSGLSPMEWWQITTGYHYKPPGTATNTTLARVYPKEGWAIASSVAPNTANGFTNGVSLIFQARPRASDLNHSDFTDGSFQMFAYGAAITDAGDNRYGKHAMQNYTLLVDGYGTATPNRWPHEKTYSSIIAFTNNSTNFTYVAADLTKSYARSNFLATGNGSGPFEATVDWGARYNTGKLSYVSGVQRHLLFMRGKYTVIYDVLQTTNAATFQWLYHVRDDTISVTNTSSAKRFKYVTPAFYSLGSVTTHVFHATSPTGITLTNMTGTNVYKNPITGEDYSVNKVLTGRTNAVWVQNAIPTTNWHFLSVVYPQSASMSTPSFTRIDDNTVAVTNGAEWDIITFDTNQSAIASFVVDIGSVASLPDPSTNAPATPSGLLASPSSGQAALSWNSVSYATSYILERTTTSGSGYSTVINTTSTSYSDTGLNNGTTYYYTVLATNSYGASAQSAEVSATPSSGGGGGAPDQPQSGGGKVRSSGQVIIQGGRLQ